MPEESRVCEREVRLFCVCGEVMGELRFDYQGSSYMRTMMLLAAMMVALGANAQETEPVRIEIPWGNSWLLTGGGPGQDDAPAPFLPADAVIRNSGNAVYVRVMDAAGTTQLRGFGLDARGEAKVRVDEGERLLVDAVGGDTRIAVRYERPKPEAPDAVPSVAFNLMNSGLTSIALEIPGAMNPNLSPKSRSAVRLDYGQEILFKGRVLFTVGPDLEPGTDLDVRALIRAQD